MAGVSQAQTNVQQNATTDTDDSTDESEEEVVEESKKQPEAVEEKKPEQKIQPKTEPKPVNKSRPVARIAIPGTVWSLVRTSDGRCFFYNPSKRHSVWERPEELKDRPDVDELLSHKPEVTTEDKEENDLQEEPPLKKIKLETEVIEGKNANKDELAQQTVLGKEPAIKVEAQEAQQRSLVSMEVRMKLFKELLAEKNISGHARWEKELHKIALDKRYLLLTSRERRGLFEEYVKDRAEKEDKETNQKINEKQELCRQLFEENSLNEKSKTEVKEIKNVIKNELAQQTALGQEAAIKVEAQEAQQRSLVSMEVRMKLFKELLAEKNISAHARWEKELHKIAYDKRYFLLTSRERRGLFEEYVKDRAEKEDKETNQKINEKQELCRQLFEENSLNEKSKTEVKEIKNVIKNELAQQTALGQEAAIKVEAQEAQQRSLVSMEVRMKLFKELLAEKNISAHARWEKELHKIAYDKRYFLLTSRERRQVFEKYVTDRAEKEDNENNQKINEKKELCQQLLEESNLNEKSEAEVKEVKKVNKNELVQQTVLGKEAATEVEAQVAQQRSVVSMEVRMKLFKELLAEKNISAHASWEKELHKIAFDKRYFFLTSQECKQVFEEYVKDRAKKEDNEKNQNINEKKELCRQLLEESNLNDKSEAKVKEAKKVNKNEVVQQTVLGKEAVTEVEAQVAQQRSVVSMEVRMKLFKELLAENNISAHASWEKELHKIASDKRYLLLTSQERRQVFEEYVKDRAEKEDSEKNQKINEKKELCSHLLEESNLNEKIDKMWIRKPMFTDYIREFTEQKQLQNPLIKKVNDFMQMLSEIPVINSSTTWSDVRSKVSSDPRFKALDADTRRENCFREYLKTVNNVNDFMQMLSEIPGINSSSTWSDVRSKVSSDPRFKAVVTDSHREYWFREYLKIVNNGQKKKRNKKPHSSSLKEKSESRQTRRVIADFKQFLAEKVTNSEDSYVRFKFLFHTNPIWEVASPLIDTEKLYNICVNGVHQKNRAILWSILDRIKLSLIKALDTVNEKFQAGPRFRNYTNREQLSYNKVWDTVKEEVQAHPRFLRYTDSEQKCEKEYNVYMRKRLLKKPKEDFKQLLKETEHITPETRTKLQQRSITLKDIECLIQNDKRYTALACIYQQREHILNGYIDELSKKNQPSHSLSLAAAPVTG